MARSICSELIVTRTPGEESSRADETKAAHRAAPHSLASPYTAAPKSVQATRLGNSARESRCNGNTRRSKGVPTHRDSTRSAGRRAEVEPGARSGTIGRGPGGGRRGSPTRSWDRRRGAGTAPPPGPPSPRAATPQPSRRRREGVAGLVRVRTSHPTINSAVSTGRSQGSDSRPTSPKASNTAVCTVTQERSVSRIRCVAPRALTGPRRKGQADRNRPHHDHQQEQHIMPVRDD